MKKTYSFYNSTTGLFTGGYFIGDEEAVQLNIPGQLQIIEGRYDALSQMVVNGQVIDYQPPSPGDNYVWDTLAKRWVLSAAAQQAADADVAARAQLTAIDLASIRALREAAIGNADAVATLQSLDAMAVPLRADVIVPADAPQSLVDQAITANDFTASTVEEAQIP